MLVIFGPSPQSYVVATGRRFFCEGMPESLDNSLSSGIAIMQVDWISIDSEGKTWVAHDYVTEHYHFDKELDPVIRTHLEGSDGKPPSNYVTFPSEAGSYFIKHVARGGWFANLEPPYINRVTEMREKYDAFDLGLTGIVFGKDTTHIYVHETGFVAFLCDEAQDPGHILHKTLAEFSEMNVDDNSGTPWLLLPRSQLCTYDSRYFFLAFKKSDSHMVQYRWNLPEEMNDRFDDLRRTAELPDERHAIGLAEMKIQLQQQQTMMMQQQLVASQIAMQQKTASMIASIENQGMKAVMAAASGRSLVYEYQYF